MDSSKVKILEIFGEVSFASSSGFLFLELSVEFNGFDGRFEVGFEEDGAVVVVVGAGGCLADSGR